MSEWHFEHKVCVATDVSATPRDTSWWPHRPFGHACVTNCQQVTLGVDSVGLLATVSIVFLAQYSTRQGLECQLQQGVGRFPKWEVKDFLQWESTDWKTDTRKGTPLSPLILPSTEHFSLALGIKSLHPTFDPLAERKFLSWPEAGKSYSYEIAKLSFKKKWYKS